MNPRQIAELHQPILDALRLRDAERADDAVHRHFATAGALFDQLADPTDGAAHHGGGEAAQETDGVGPSGSSSTLGTEPGPRAGRRRARATISA